MTTGAKKYILISFQIRRKVNVIQTGLYSSLYQCSCKIQFLTACFLEKVPTKAEVPRARGNQKASLTPAASQPATGLDQGVLVGRTSLSVCSSLRGNQNWWVWFFQLGAVSCCSMQDSLWGAALSSSSVPHRWDSSFPVWHLTDLRGLRGTNPGLLYS